MNKEDEANYKISTNATYNIIKNMSAILFPLITIPYSTRILGPENIGRINFGNSIVSYFSLIASLGITTHAVRECGMVKNDRILLSKVSSQVFSINVISTLFAYICITFALLVIPSLQAYRYLIFIQSLTIIFTTLGTEWINTAVGDFKFITKRTIMFQVISLLLMILFVREQSDYIKYVYICLFATCGSSIVNIIYRKRYCDIKFTGQMMISYHLKPILILFSMLLAQTIFVSTDITILGIMRNDVEVGLYSVSTKIYNLVNILVSSVASVVLPDLARLFSQKDYLNINEILKHSMNIILVIGLPAIVGINILAEEIILTLSGQDYIGAITSLRILTISLLFSFVGGFVGNIILLPSKNDKIMLLSNIVGAVINLLLNILLIPKFGLNAAAATTAIANGISFAICLPFVDKNIVIKLKLRMIRGPIISVISMGIILIFIKMLPIQLYLKTFISILGGAMIYFAILLLVKDEFATKYKNQLFRKIKHKK